MESALALLTRGVQAVAETQRLALLDALGYVAAEDVSAPMQTPPFDRSPLDGYALHSEDIASASNQNPAVLAVIGEACAGCGIHYTVARGQALRLMTGAPVPSDCDCVVRQEDTDEGMAGIVALPVRMCPLAPCSCTAESGSPACISACWPAWA